MENYLASFRDVHRLICALLAFAISMGFGSSYAATLALVTHFYHYAIVHLSLLVPRS